MKKKLSLLCAFSMLLIIFSACGTKINLQPAQSNSQSELGGNVEYLKPEPYLFHVKDTYLYMGIGENAEVGEYRRDIKIPFNESFEPAHGIDEINYGAGQQRSITGFANGDLIAVANGKAGAEFEIQISHDGGKSFFISEFEKDETFLNYGIGYNAQIGFTTKTDGYIMVNSYGGSLGKAHNNVVRLYFTTDGGKSWYRGNVPKTEGDALSAGVYFETPMEGVIFYQRAFFQTDFILAFATKDGGATWTKQEVVNDNRFTNSMAEFWAMQPKYVKSNALKSGGEWVLPLIVKTYCGFFSYDSLPYEEREIAKSLGDLTEIKKSFDEDTLTVELPLMLEGDTWKIYQNKFTNPSDVIIFNYRTLSSMYLQYYKTAKMYEKGEYSTEPEKFPAFFPIGKLSQQAMLADGAYIYRTVGYHFTQDEVLYQFTNEPSGTFCDNKLLLRQTTTSFEAVGFKSLWEWDGKVVCT